MSAEDFEIPNEQHDEQSEVSIEIIREELFILSEKGEISYTPKYIQKANRDKKLRESMIESS